jgi:hypothetical protein
MLIQSSSSCSGRQKKRNDAIFDIVVELMVCYPSLLVHPNHCKKDPLLLKTKPPMRALDMPQKSTRILSLYASVALVGSCQCGGMHSAAALKPKIPVHTCNNLATN